MKIALLAVLFGSVCAAQEKAPEKAQQRWPKAKPAFWMPSFFSDNMVIQQRFPVRVWGRSKQGAAMEVELDGKRESTTAGSGGNWATSLPSGLASKKALELIVRQDGEEVRRFKNVVFGDIWIVAGQSNMSRPANGEQMKTANYPLIRFFNSSGVTPREDRLDWPTGWSVCTPDSIRTAGDRWRDPKKPEKVKVRAFSEVGYVFGRTVHRRIRIPIGLIQLSAGGSTAKDWTPLPGIQEKYPFDEPIRPAKHKPGALFHIRMRKLRGFRVRGVAWYQGEDDGRNLDYHRDLRKLIESWREFGTYDLPFYMAQIGATSYASGMLAVYESQQWVMNHVAGTGIAPSNDIYAKHIESQFARMESMTRANVRDRHAKHLAGLILRLVRNDLETGWPLNGMSNPHPPNKELIATRLGEIALSQTYGKGNADSVFGPMFGSSWIDGEKIVVKFKYAGAGLKSVDGKPLNWFEISENRRREGKRRRGYAFVKAVARIVGRDTIEVRADGVSKPRFVRFAWHMYARHNLVNSAGLPALPFRTEKTADPRKR